MDTITTCNTTIEISARIIAPLPRARFNRPKAPAYRRATSLPLELEAPTHVPPKPLSTHGQRRASLGTVVDCVLLDISNVSRETRRQDEALQELEQKRIALEAALDRVCQQLDDHEVYHHARYPPPLGAFEDKAANEDLAQTAWDVLREENGRVRRLTDEVKPLPFRDNRMPIKFPRRLAGIVALSERQVDGLIIGYMGEEAAKGSRVTKREKLIRFLGVDYDLVQRTQKADERQAARAANFKARNTRAGLLPELDI